MRILASTKSVTTLPKAPYDGFFECVSFQWGGATELDPTGVPIRQPSATALTLIHQIDAVSSEMIEAWAKGVKRDITVLFERMGTRNPFVYLSVGLAQAFVFGVEHRAAAGGAAVPSERLAIKASAVTGIWYEEGGRELGRTSFSGA